MATSTHQRLHHRPVSAEELKTHQEPLVLLHRPVLIIFVRSFIEDFRVFIFFVFIWSTEYFDDGSSVFFCFPLYIRSLYLPVNDGNEVRVIAQHVVNILFEGVIIYLLKEELAVLRNPVVASAITYKLLEIHFI